jgi:aminoglycoside phosphotransferase (APT) family kinase protein
MSPHVVEQSWDSFQDLNPERPQHRLIEQILELANFEEIVIRALQIRKQRDKNCPETLSCKIITDKLSSGWSNVIFEVGFSDGVVWLLRVRLHQEIDQTELTTRYISEVTTMNYVRQHTTVPVPEVYGFEASLNNNRFGYRYMLISKLPGRTMSGHFSKTIPQQWQDQIASEFAESFRQISYLRFDGIGRLFSSFARPEDAILIPATRLQKVVHSSLEYYWLDKRAREAARKSTIDPAKAVEEEAAAFILRQAIPFMVSNATLHGPFALCHQEMNHKNILLSGSDEDGYKITGIIDWDGVQVLPLECCVANPDFDIPQLSSEATTREMQAYLAQYETHLERHEISHLLKSGVSEQELWLKRQKGTLLIDLFRHPRREIVSRATVYKSPVMTSLLLIRAIKADFIPEGVQSLIDKSAKLFSTRQ